MNFTLIVPIYAICAIIGSIIVKNDLPYLIKMGSTRLNLYKSVGVVFVGIALFNAVFANTIHSLVLLLYKGTGSTQSDTFTFSDGSQSFTLNHLADLFVNVWWSRVLIDSTILFFLLVCGFIVGLMF